jgi:HAD superfamily hydrolase (TIGR01509 family)
MVKAVIFDVDGTLIDSVDLHARAWQDIFYKYGVNTDFQAVRDQIGKGGDKLMKIFLSPEQIARQGEEIEAERTDLFKRKYLPKVKPFPELHDLFTRLRNDGIKIALASSAKDDELEAYKKITGIGPFLAEDSSSDDVSNSKPDPDVFRAAQKKLGVEPGNIIAVGDTQYDAESAGKAGMATIGLLCGGSNPAKLRGCIAVYRDPADMLKNYATSPLGRNDDKNKEKSMSSNHPLYFLMGVGIGVAAGILFAPKSGSQTRDYLRSKSEEGTRYAKNAVSDTIDLAKQKTDDLKKTAADSIERGKQAVKAPLETISSAVDAGKKVFQEPTEPAT